MFDFFSFYLHTCSNSYDGYITKCFSVSMNGMSPAKAPSLPDRCGICLVICDRLPYLHIGLCYSRERGFGGANHLTLQDRSAESERNMKAISPGFNFGSRHPLKKKKKWWNLSFFTGEFFPAGAWGYERFCYQWTRRQRCLLSSLHIRYCRLSENSSWWDLCWFCITDQFPRGLNT